MADDMKSPVEILMDAMTTFVETYDPECGLMEHPISGTLKPGESVGDDKLLDELNKIFFPVMVAQGLEESVKDQIQEACAEENVLLEHNIIKFDSDTKRAQLIALCALLISRQSNSPDYQAFKQASQVRKTMKLKIQNDNQAAAQALADRYLSRVKTTSSNPAVKQIATDMSI